MKRIILFISLFVILMLAGCTTTYNNDNYQPQTNDAPSASDAEFEQAILARLEQNSGAASESDMNYIKSLGEKLKTDSTFTSTQVKILLTYLGVLNPPKLLPEITSFRAPMPNVYIAVADATDNSVEVPFRNNLGTAITFPLITNEPLVIPQTGTTCNNPVLSGMYEGNPIQFESSANPTVVGNGDAFTLKWDCENLNPAPAVGARFEADLSFKYTNTETSLSYTATGIARVKYT
jgi:hypothetical protein